MHAVITLPAPLITLTSADCGGQVGVPKDAERLGMRLLTTGVLIGIFNCVVSGGSDPLFGRLLAKQSKSIMCLPCVLPGCLTQHSSQSASKHC